MKILLISITILSFNLSAKGVIRNVPAQYSTIQIAINASLNGDTILVQPGTYFENVNFRGKSIVLTSKYHQNNDYWYIESTIINGSAPSQPDSASCVLIINHEDSTTVLQGFTITGGSGTKWADEHGAGLYREGGGVLVAFSSPVIQNNIISGNNCITGGGVSSTGGGGLRIGDCYSKLFNNIIINNSARYGAGVVLNYAGGEYKNNIICKNFGSQDVGGGAAMWLNGNFSRPKTIENNTIVSNTAINGTPGIHAFGGVQGSIRNNIIWNNTSPAGTQISGNNLTVRYCDVQGGYNGAGNINIDPQFDSTNYYLKINSPCVDKGDSSSTYNDPPDPNNPLIAKWPSRGLLRNDMGAYGGPGSKVIANTIVDIKGHSELISPDKFYLGQNFPNPFNPRTVIHYYLAVSSNVSLKIYDIMGKEIFILVNEKKGVGNHSVEFDGNNLASGEYFYKIEANNLSTGQEHNFVQTKKMLLIK